MQLQLKNPALAHQQPFAAKCTLAAAALSPLRGNCHRRPVIAAKASAVLEAVQQAANETVSLPIDVLQQHSEAQTTQLSSADFYQIFTMGETLGQVNTRLNLPTEWIHIEPQYCVIAKLSGMFVLQRCASRVQVSTHSSARFDKH